MEILNNSDASLAFSNTKVMNLPKNNSDDDSTSNLSGGSSNGSDSNHNSVKDISSTSIRPPTPGSPGVQDQKFKHLQKVRANIQKKTFTKWCNSYLHKRNLTIDDLYRDIGDGSMLWQLLEILSGESLGKPNAGKLRVQKLENVNVCLSYINSKVHLENIGAEDIVDGNGRLILGLIWTIILRFQIEHISIDLTQEERLKLFARSDDEEWSKTRVKSDIFDAKATSKNALLVWCKRRTNGYRGIDIENFSNSWRNGLAFLALIHSYRPDIINYEMFDAKNGMENLREAFDIAETYLGIYRLLDPEDVSANPDEKSILTYVSCLYHFFHNPKLLGKMSPTKLFKFKKSSANANSGAAAPTNSQINTTTTSTTTPNKVTPVLSSQGSKNGRQFEDPYDKGPENFSPRDTRTILNTLTYIEDEDYDEEKTTNNNNSNKKHLNEESTSKYSNNNNLNNNNNNVKAENLKINNGNKINKQKIINNNNKKIMSDEGINKGEKVGDEVIIKNNLNENFSSVLAKENKNLNNLNLSKTTTNNNNSLENSSTATVITSSQQSQREENQSPSILQQIKQKLTGVTGTSSNNNSTTTENLIEPTSVAQLTSINSNNSTSGSPPKTFQTYSGQDYYRLGRDDSTVSNKSTDSTSSKQQITTNKDSSKPEAMSSSTIIKKTVTTTRTSGGAGGGGAGGGYYSSGGGSAGFGMGGGAGGFIEGSFAGSPKATIAYREKEKKELQDLNERFASYIERVRRLEKQHGELIEEIVAIKNELIRIVSSVRAQFESELRDARRELDDTSREKARIEVRCNRIEDDIDEYRRKYDDISRLHHTERDKLLRLEVLLSEKDGELANLQKKLDQANDDIERYRRELERLLDELANAKITNEDELLIRVDLENKLQSLQEDLDFQQQLHQATLKELMEGIRRDDSGEFRRIFQNELSLAIKDIRSEYENISKMMYPNNEEWYKMKMQEFMELTQRKNVEEQSAKDDSKRSRTRVTEISTEIIELRNSNASLEKRIIELERAISNENSDFEAQLAQRDFEMQELQERIAAQLFELRELMDTKLRLDLEIAAYRRLLEGEENRLNLSPESIKHVRKAISQIGTREVYGGDSLSRALPGESSSKTSYQRTSKGPLSIFEIDPNGEYIALENTSKLKEQPIGGWQIRRNLDNRDNIVFTFPSNYVIKPGKTIRIYASGYYDNKPENLEFKERRSWGAGSNVSTVLYTDKGEEKAAHMQKTISH